MEDDLDDDLELRGVHDEIVDFIEENRESIIEEAISDHDDELFIIRR